MHDVFGATKGHPKMDDMNVHTVAGLGMRKHCKAVLEAIVAQPIPRDFDANLMPKNPDNKSQIVLTTLLQCISLIWSLLKEKFPNHHDFPPQEGANYPEWLSKLMNDFKKEWNRNFAVWELDPDLKFGIARVKPLHMKNHPDADEDELHDRSCWHHQGEVDNNGVAVVSTASVASFRSTWCAISWWQEEQSKKG